MLRCFPWLAKYDCWLLQRERIVQSKPPLSYLRLRCVLNPPHHCNIHIRRERARERLMLLKCCPQMLLITINKNLPPPPQKSENLAPNYFSYLRLRCVLNPPHYCNIHIGREKPTGRWILCNTHD